jgi:hypothetical protein
MADKEAPETERVTQIWPKDLKAALREFTGARGMTDFTVDAVRRALATAQQTEQRLARAAAAAMGQEVDGPPSRPVAQDQGQQQESVAERGLTSDSTIIDLQRRAAEAGIDLQLGLRPRDPDTGLDEAGETKPHQLVSHPAAATVEVRTEGRCPICQDDELVAGECWSCGYAAPA